ncbi:MAG: hypothetical protein ACP5HK_07555, partial [Acidilobus sp.]
MSKPLPQGDRASLSPQVQAAQAQEQPQAVASPPTSQVDLASASLAQLLDAIAALKRSGLLG